MSGLDKNRYRNQTICFRATYEERRAIEERIAICGIPKGKYYLSCAMGEPIRIEAGKFRSDRLSLEVRRLSEQLERATSQDENICTAITDCRFFLKQLVELMEGKQG